MAATIVVGTQWGDEGKGKFTDLIAKEMTMVVRYQGGHNAGHTLVVDGESFALQLVPSGVLYDHITPVIGNGVVVDPVVLLAEMDKLTAKGVDCSRLRVSGNAHVIFPYHQELDRLIERHLGKNKLGTTKRGIGPTYADKAARVGLRVIDLINPTRFAERLRERLEENNEVLKALGAQPLDYDKLLADYSKAADRLRPFVTNTVVYLHEATRRGANILFEGAQGTFLDIDHGTYPYVTSSSTTAGCVSVSPALPISTPARPVVALASCSRSAAQDGSGGAVRTSAWRWIASVAVPLPPGLAQAARRPASRVADTRAVGKPGLRRELRKVMCMWRLHAARGKFVERGRVRGRARNPAQNADESGAALRYDSAASTRRRVHRFSRKTR